MVIQRLVLIHPRDLEIPSIQDFAATKENTTAENLPFSKEETEARDDPITLEKLGLKDPDTNETDDVEKVKKAEVTTTENVSEKAITKVASDAPKKVSADRDKIETQEVSSEKAEISAQERSTESTADKDSEQIVTGTLKKVDLNLST